MRSFDPLSDSDCDEARALHAQSWQLEALTYNPEYTCWGPYEDYMARDSDEHSWEGRIVYPNWAQHKLTLDDLNEVVNFYFEVTRTSRTCDACAGSGYNQGTKHLADTFYNHLHTQDIIVAGTHGGRVTALPDFLGGGYLLSDHHEGWHDKITQDEVEALITEKRLLGFTHDWVKGKGWQPKDPFPRVTAEMVNAGQKKGGLLDPHDGINRHILIETRAKRLGVWGSCGVCEGAGHIYTEPTAKLGLVYWLLHPRKGCSRGVHVESIQQQDLPAVFAFLRAAAERNADRFAKIPPP